MAGISGTSDLISAKQAAGTSKRNGLLRTCSGDDRGAAVARGPEHATAWGNDFAVQR